MIYLKSVLKLSKHQTRIEAKQVTEWKKRYFFSYVPQRILQLSEAEGTSKLGVRFAGANPGMPRQWKIHVHLRLPQDTDLDRVPVTVNITITRLYGALCTNMACFLRFDERGSLIVENRPIPILIC